MKTNTEMQSWKYLKNHLASTSQKQIKCLCLQSSRTETSELKYAFMALIITVLLPWG